jgi:glycine hydroxymethyltransferase
MTKLNNALNSVDLEISQIISLEETRQMEQIDLIASENYAPYAVRQALTSVLTNKYAEGYPTKRYYAGCKYVDQIEIIAIERCKKIFKAESMHANVQPHSGSQANIAIYSAILKPGDTIMGMSLASGGHLTHGHPVNISGCLYNTVQYGLDPKTDLLDYDAILKLAIKEKPKLIIAGASAYSQIIDFEQFSQIAQKIGAYLMADIAHISGLIAAGLHPSPVPYADFISSTTHKTLRGPRGGFILCKEKYKDIIDRAIMPGTQGGPFMNVIAAKAVAFKLAAEPEFKEYQEQVIKNAQIMAQELKNFGYNIVSGGTNNHLFILDLRSKKITGKESENILEKCNIDVSRSAIPNDPEKPWITSGIRIGTPAITTRGCKTDQAREIAIIMDYIISGYSKEKENFNINQAKKLVQKITSNLEVIK